MAWFDRSDGYFVYWLIDADDWTRYVGYTDNPSRRIAQHRKQKPWFSEITQINIRRYATKEEALRTEALEIEFGEELYNLALSKHLVRDAFLDASNGIRYPVLERYDNVPVWRFSNGR